MQKKNTPQNQENKTAEERGLILVHTDGGDCHGTPIVNGLCTGCGIPPDMQSTEFWPPDQVKGKTTSKLKKHHVLVREVHIRTLEIMAETKEDAIALVAQGKGNDIGFEWSHSMSRSTWTAEEVASRDQTTVGSG